MLKLNPLIVGRFPRGVPKRPFLFSRIVRLSRRVLKIEKDPVAARLLAMTRLMTPIRPRKTPCRGAQTIFCSIAMLISCEGVRALNLARKAAQVTATVL